MENCKMLVLPTACMYVMVHSRPMPLTFLAELLAPYLACLPACLACLPTSASII
jgi:hypothetical protein